MVFVNIKTNRKKEKKNPVIINVMYSFEYAYLPFFV